MSSFDKENKRNESSLVIHSRHKSGIKTFAKRTFSTPVKKSNFLEELEVEATIEKLLDEVQSGIGLLESKLNDLTAQQSVKGTPEQNQRIRSLELKVEQMATDQNQREKRQEAEMTKKEQLYKQ